MDKRLQDKRLLRGERFINIAETKPLCMNLLFMLKILHKNFTDATLLE